MRLAASVAQGLAFGAGVGVVPDLRSGRRRAARACSWIRRVRRVLVANDARMREVYWAAFEVAGCSDAARARARERRDGRRRCPTAGAGAGPPPDGASKAWPALAERCRAAGAALHPDLLPRASEILALARPRVAAGQILDPADALPVYVRDNVAESSAVIKLQ